MEERISENQQMNVYEKNKSVNKEKIRFCEFWHYCSMTELFINDFLENLFWKGVLELFLFLVSLGLAISYFEYLGWLLFLIVHCVRATFGFLCIYYFPQTTNLIEEIKGFENSSIQDIQKNIIDLFKKLLSLCQNKLRPLVITYLILTIVCMLIDIILFISLLVTWSNHYYSIKNIVTLYLLCIFFICNMTYFSMFISMTSTFPKKMMAPINQMIKAEFRGVIASLSKAESETNQENNQQNNNQIIDAHHNIDLGNNANNI